MHLRKKTILAICVVLIGLIGIFELVLSHVLLARFTELEHESVGKDIARAQKALLSEARQLTVKAHDWSSWDDSYQFVQDLNEEYEQSNLQRSTLENILIEDVQFYSPSGEFVFGLQYGTHGRTHDPGIHAEFVQAFAERKSLQQFSERDRDKFLFHEGFLRLPSGIVMFAAQPILHSDGSGPPQGTLVFVKLVDEELIRKVADQAELSLQLLRTDRLQPQDLAELLPAFTGETIAYQKVQDEDTILGYGLIKDADETASFILRIQEERDIYLQGIITLRVLFFALVALGSVVCVLIAFLLRSCSSVSSLPVCSCSVSRSQALPLAEIRALVFSSLVRTS